MDFSEKLNSWLASVLSPDVPSTVIAFSFNLFELESEDAKYGIELIGTDEFDPDDSDWACDEAWVASPRSISIPGEFTSGGWEECLRDAKMMLTKTLDESSGPITKLKETRAVAIGFVDGDLELIWQR
ncbi:hypothetical protein GM658_28495 [Pseudoduganella eburnea]|uniref:Uncharacterized protein n=1 Tax=Massilia eburnea TaxID=1776165 RepID=A0A6L6QQT6_9BURK|nr:hypothetical protein [Massilia eburnea]MTW14560.1 hypothetical protein [Massilia eburnea]